jgi:hypothetical protein
MVAPPVKKFQTFMKCKVHKSSPPIYPEPAKSISYPMPLRSILIFPSSPPQVFQLKLCMHFSSLLCILHALLILLGFMLTIFGGEYKL